VLLGEELDPTTAVLSAVEPLVLELPEVVPLLGPLGPLVTVKVELPPSPAPPAPPAPALPNTSDPSPPQAAAVVARIIRRPIGRVIDLCLPGREGAFDLIGEFYAAWAEVAEAVQGSHDVQKGCGEDAPGGMIRRARRGPPRPRWCAGPTSATSRARTRRP